MSLGEILAAIVGAVEQASADVHLRDDPAAREVFAGLVGFPGARLGRVLHGRARCTPQITFSEGRHSVTIFGPEFPYLDPEPGSWEETIIDKIASAERAGWKEQGR